MQKILYLDDSGTLDYKDEKQPFLIFSGPLLDNSNRNLVEEKMLKIINDCKSKIQSKIYWLLQSNLSSNRASKLANFISDKIIPGTFEIHAAELLRGDNEYMVLDRNYREGVIISCLSLIKDFDIKIFGVVCNKKDIEKDTSINDKDKNEFMIRNSCKCFADYFDEQLKQDKNNSAIIIDAGNSAIKNYFKPYIWSKMDTLISHEIIEYDSHSSPLIQLADVCSFTISLYERSLIPNLLNPDHRREINQFYPIIKDNLNLVYLSDILYPKIEPESQIK